MTPRMALKIAATRSAPLRLHLAERADSTSLSRPPSGRRPGGQSWMRACVLANFPDAPNPPLSLLSLSCGACLAERKDVPAGVKKGPRGRRATSTTFPDAPNPPLLLLSLSCGACLAERKDVPAGAKKGPRGRRATSTTFPDAPNPPLLLLSLSCGTCLAERKDAPAGAKKRPAGSAGNKHNTTIKKHVPPEGYPG